VVNYGKPGPSELADSGVHHSSYPRGVDLRREVRIGRSLRVTLIRKVDNVDSPLGRCVNHTEKKVIPRGKVIPS